ncbi:MAG TPA: flavin reductase family protein [Candidatus Acidoferrales bacterium]|nr:flavin reductase family protein [Candidatus Acidoferrales bacterium]
MAPSASAEFRRALSRFATGVTIVTVARKNGETKGMTANSFTSVSLDPALILVCVDLRSRTHALLKSARHFGVSVLDERQQALAEYFAKPDADPAKMPGLGIRIRRDAGGTPFIDGCLAHLVCRRVASRRSGDHTIFIGEVEYMACREGRPLLFYGGRYHGLAGAKH